jgi:hypothetical protein
MVEVKVVVVEWIWATNQNINLVKKPDINRVLLS